MEKNKIYCNDLKRISLLHTIRRKKKKYLEEKEITQEKKASE